MNNEIDNSPALQNLLDGINKMADELMCSEFDRKRAEDKVVELNKQLEDKYSTETYLLVKRETLDGLAEKFEELGSEFSNLDGLLEDINSYANSINDDSGYNDASNYQCYAREYADEIRELLKVETEEVAE